MGLGPGLQGEGRAADVDGGARSTHPGSWGARGCVHVSPRRVLVGRRASPEAPPPRWRAAQIWGKQPDVAPASPRPCSQQPRRPTGGDRVPGQAVLQGLAPDALSPLPVLPGPGLGAAGTDVSTCLQQEWGVGVSVCVCVPVL